MALRRADSKNKYRYKRKDCIGGIRDAYLVIVEDCVSSGLHNMIIPPVQRKICMKVHRTVPSTTISRMKNISHNFIRLACEREHMGNVEPSQQDVGMGFLFAILRHLKFVSTLTEAKIMALVSA